MAPFQVNNPNTRNDDESSLSSCVDDDLSHTASSKFHTEDDEEEGHKEIQAQLTKKETAAVFRIRVIVILVLVAVASAVSAVVFRITKSGETEEFKSQWDGSSQKVLTAFSGIVHQMGAVSGLGVAIIAHGVDHFRDWPFVTLSSFQQRSGNVRTLSKALFVSIAPRVALEQFEDWDAYIMSDDNYWISEGLNFQEDEGLVGFEDQERIQKSKLNPGRPVDMMHYFDEDEQIAMINKAAPFYLPVWQTSPVLETGFINEDQMQPHGVLAPQSEIVSIVLDNATAVIGGFTSARPGSIHSADKRTALFATLRSMAEKKEVEYFGDPMAQIFLPIFDSFNRTTRKPVALISALVHWRAYFRDILPANIEGVDVVLENTCDGFFTFQISGDEAFIVGSGDHHNAKFNQWGRHGEFSATVLDDGTRDGLKLHQDGCTYKVHVYPSQLFWDSYNTNTPSIITCSIVAVFLFTILMFLFYDFLVERRQRIVLHKATQSTAIVSSLFPKNVRDRLINGAGNGSVSRDSFSLGNKSRLKGFLDGNSDDEKEEEAPIADLFPECTVFFADIAGFTAWSSTREPSQVFILLQTVYQAFDYLAKRRKVFKVETIGDSYMAVTGLPEPQPNHAIIMVRFAHDCLLKLSEITKNLESSLGPDTNDLAMRFGLHSGPVTAGVLRGDRARFQLFGDTVNTASRMESTGIRSKIQVSQTTADALIEAGKGHWIKQRKDMVTAKGKGNLVTFWANPTSQQKGTNTTASVSGSDGSILLLKAPEFKQVNDRLVDWMVDMLLDSVKKIVYARRQCRVKASTDALTYKPLDGATCMDEVKEVIEMPAFNPKLADASFTKDYVTVWIPPKAIENLRAYVHAIASLYRDNPFHNFEHACHVSMSVIKLLKRIVAPDLTPEQLETLKKNQLARDLHDFTHGINSDPMGVFAIIFSALIHDVDHRGVSNMQLIKEAPEMANRYSNQSIAEQNSVDMAWDLLMEDQFQELRKLLFASESDLMRFRQMCVNVVLATDIFDKELAALRKSRWAKAFPGDGAEPEITSNQNVVSDLRSSGVTGVDGDLRATIVIEHIIQASDVSHTMQHWHIYRKWNEKLFTEMYLAFRTGRMAKDPATFWYQGEIGFFDNYVIPLAKKLKECGVFGVSSAEFLNYAIQNRAEWEERGQDVVKQLSERLSTQYEASAITVSTQMNSSSYSSSS